MLARLLDLIRGFPGKPSHPPLTDAAIGAYTVGVAMLIAGALGLEEEAMAHGALLAISGGLIITVPTALTGLLDWLQIEKGTPARTLATTHLLVMVTATLLFAATWLAQRPGYDDGEIETLGWILGLGAETLLTVGGYLGGTLVYIYGIRVLDRRDAPLRDALIPGRAEYQAAGRPQPPAQSAGDPGVGPSGAE
jgi:uncharacterized membrane protein